MTALPKGWAETTLGEVAETSLGKMLDRGKASGGHTRPYLRNVNVQWGRIDKSDVLSMDIPSEQEEHFRLRKGDLLICEGGEVGRCAIWNGDEEYMAFQKALHRVRPLGGMDARYLRYLLEHLSLRGSLVRWATGSTIKHLPQEQLRQLPVPFPPAAEQQRITAALEEYLSMLAIADTSVKSALRRLSMLRARAAAGLVEAFEAPLRRLDWLLEGSMINGKSVPSQAGGFPVLRLTALRDGLVDLTEFKHGAWDASAAAPFLVRRGDFFIGRGNGSIRLVGRGALVASDPHPVAFPDTMIRVRTDSSKIRGEYLAAVWNSRHVRRQIESKVRTTAGIYKVNQSILREIQIRVPRLDEQDEIMRRWYSTVSVIDRLSASVRSAASRASGLRSSLLTQAFNGQLVSQDPNDEPASELLARIRAERAAAAPKQRARAARTRKELAAPPTRVTGDNYQQEALPL